MRTQYYRWILWIWLIPHGLYGQIPVVDLGPDTTLCYGDSLFVSVQAMGLPIRWSDGSERAYRWLKTADRYMVQVGDESQFYTDTIQLDFHPQLKPAWPLEIGQCPGDTILLEAGPSNRSYFWSTGTKDAILKVPPLDHPTFYVVWVEDGNCMAHKGITVRPRRNLHACLESDSTMHYGRNNCPEWSLLPPLENESASLVVRDLNGRTMWMGEAATLRRQIAVLPVGTYFLQVDLDAQTCFYTFFRQP